MTRGADAMSRDPQTPEEGSADEMSDQRYGGGMSERERAELHQRIMNLRADQAGLQPSPLRLAYRDGHRDARHAAAELVAALPVVGDTDDYYATMSTEHRPSTDPGAAPVDVIARLTSALQGLMEFAAGALGTAACHGDKCRLAWCESCYDEDDANAAVDRACVAYRQAEAALALAAQQATPPASPEPPDRTREAFRAGFLAVCKRKGDTQLLDILTRVWSFDGVAAADLEPEAYEAWRAASPVPVAPASSRPQERA